MTTTYAELRQLLLSIGMLTEDAAAELSPGPVNDEDIPYALVDLGVAVDLEADSVNYLEETYRDFLERAARCSGGAVTITQVRLTDDELQFSRNGREMSWYVDSGDIPDHLAVGEFIDLLEPDDDRKFHSIPQMESGDASFYVLATPEQAKTLTEQLGLDFD